MFTEAETSIQIVSPFLSVNTAQLLCGIVKEKHIECSIITRVYLNDLLSGVNSIEAIRMMLEAGIKVYAIRGLHAKAYLIDSNIVMLGSANFTIGGLSKNFELSIITDDETVVFKVETIIEELIGHCENDGIISYELLEEIKADYEKAYKKYQKGGTYLSAKMYGADRVGDLLFGDDRHWEREDVIIEEWDPVFELFSNDVKTKKFDHKVWIKFEGKSDNRFSGRVKPGLTKVVLDGKEIAVICFRNRPSGVSDGDCIYLSYLANDDDNRPITMIAGRAVAKTYINKCRVRSEWILEHPWMKEYCFFCEIRDIQLLDCSLMDCIPLNAVYDKLGKDTYSSTIDKEEVKNMSLCQCRRSHLQMTLAAKEFIDGELDKREKEVGFQNIPERRK